MRDDLVDGPFIRVQSTSQSSLFNQDSPVLGGRLALPGFRESKAMDDSEPRSSFYQASRPTSVAHDNGGEFSLVLGETSIVNTGGFTFDPSLDFFGQEQWTSPANEKQPWAFSWTPPDLSSSSHEYDTPPPLHLSPPFSHPPSPSTSRRPRHRNEERGNRAVVDSMPPPFPRRLVLLVGNTSPMVFPHHPIQRERPRSHSGSLLHLRSRLGECHKNPA
jgi:hypothetical protein